MAGMTAHSAEKKGRYHSEERAIQGDRGAFDLQGKAILRDRREINRGRVGDMED